MGESIRKFAARIGVSPTAVRKAIVTGRILVEADGTIDPAQAPEWEKNRDAKRAPTGKPGSTVSPETNGMAHNFQTARAVREAAEAAIAQLNYRKLLGSLLDAKEIEQAAFDSAHRLKDLLQSMASRLAPPLVGLDQKAIHDAIQAEADYICDEMAAKRKSKGQAA